jgi:Holliday junction resolvasome RuvABC endonuclease subunit
LEKDRVILSLDQALLNTGYCVLDLEGNILTKGVIKTKSKDNYFNRLSCIEAEVAKLIDIYNPQHVFYEDVFAVGKGAWRKLTDVKVVIELYLYKTNITFTAMSPLLNRKNSWRKLVGLTTSNKKDWQVICNEKNEHIADAIGIGLGGLKYLDEDE